MDAVIKSDVKSRQIVAFNIQQTKVLQNLNLLLRGQSFSKAILGFCEFYFQNWREAEK